ncbi:MAG: NAD(P)-dependent alcohol dehydrogenase, partial [Anaerolineae bacterium]|nr:NAD(P)-dependent alcohol dehydrogenase [Anaerolineae bacterium]
MKAIIWTKFGPPEVLQVREAKKPTPKNNEVLIKVATTAVTASDCIMRSLRFRLWPPKRLMFSMLAGLM